MTEAWNFSSAIIIFSELSACATIRKLSSTARTLATPVRKIAWLSARMIFSIYFLPLFLRMNLYWSITQATPFLVLPLPFSLVSRRTTRPVQCTSTSLGVPSTFAGSVISNSIDDPTERSVLAWMYTPAELTLAVVASAAAFLRLMRIGNCSGNRFPVLASDISPLVGPWASQGHKLFQVSEDVRFIS